jgi:tRNA (uracil-5-)-methyltransferase TRM9
MDKLTTPIGFCKVLFRCVHFPTRTGTLYGTEYFVLYTIRKNNFYDIVRMEGSASLGKRAQPAGETTVDARQVKQKKTSVKGKRAVVIEGLDKGGDSDYALHTPDIEKDHVHKVYDDIAEHWNHTRYAPWPQVAEFIQSIPANSLVADVGCGNGKYMKEYYRNQPVSNGRFLLGSDRSLNLLKICAGQNLEVSHFDNMTIPYRDGVFDAGISIAVFHHFSTKARRLQALAELSRIIRPGGKLLIYAWAQDQPTGSRRRFEGPDVFVKWHLRGIDKLRPKNRTGDGSKGPKSVDKPDSPQQPQGKGETEKQDVYQRYCHVYQKGELTELAALTPGLVVEKEYFDTGNWAVIATKQAPQ